MKKVFGDQRGYFLESYRASIFRELELDVSFVQDNESKSIRGTIRGLHFQAPPYAQDKLLRVVVGAVYDVVVDVRVGSPTYGQHYGIELSGSNKKSFFIPKGFAHGFACLENDTIVQYKCSDYYHPEAEGGLLWNDPALGINWPVQDATVSEKDLKLPGIDAIKSPFR